MTNGMASALTDALRGRYAIERELGRGGMATVYLARDLKHDRLVAIKVLRPESSAMLGAERFLREVQLTAKLQHPHILPLLDSGDAQGVLYYVMPFVEGESLRQRLGRERQLSLEEALQITRGVAAALAYAHQQGVIHRDIKPENILLFQGEPMVADFGIALAAAAAGGERLTETGLSLGTPAYMSPEQASGPATLDAEGLPPGQVVLILRIEHDVVNRNCYAPQSLAVAVVQALGLGRAESLVIECNNVTGKVVQFHRLTVHDAHLSVPSVNCRLPQEDVPFAPNSQWRTGGVR